ncbi:MAG: hypothetical protein CHACPFDD_03745 [Phycisphaerae bacterium]|nr:hypothetical protein [Phycisphaerae bacterium]
MPFAIISDIHSNLEALLVALEDIDRRKITEILCLGDVVGYGPNPKECVDLVRQRCRTCLMGNHDHAVLYEPCNFNLPAERACYWTRQLLDDEPDDDVRRERWDFLGALRVRYETDDFLLVHGSPRRPINEYLFPEDVFTNPQKVMANFERIEPDICFVGHTHQPGVFLDDPYFDPPHELADAPFFDTRGERAIVNVGSIGQPRDRDPRASYLVVYTDEDESPTGAKGVNSPAFGRLRQIEFVRLEYDVEKTVQKILAEPALDDFLGHRLYEGR